MLSIDEMPSINDVKLVDIFNVDKEMFPVKVMSYYSMIFQLQPNILIPWVQHIGLMEKDIDKQMIRYQFGTTYLRKKEENIQHERGYSGRFDIAFQSPTISGDALVYTKTYYICELMLICQEVYSELGIEKYDIRINHPAYISELCSIFDTPFVDVYAKIKNNEAKSLFAGSKPLSKLLSSKIVLNDIKSFLTNLNINEAQYKKIMNLFRPLVETANNFRLRTEKLILDFESIDKTQYYCGYYISSKLKGENNEFTFMIGGEYSQLIQKFTLNQTKKDMIGIGVCFNMCSFSTYYNRSIDSWHFDVLVYDDKFIHSKEEISLIEKLWIYNIKATSFLSDCENIINEGDMEKRCRKQKIRFLVKVIDDNYIVRELSKKKSSLVCSESNVNFIIDKIKSRMNAKFKVKKEQLTIDKTFYFYELCSKSVRFKGKIMKCPYHANDELTTLHTYNCSSFKAVFTSQFNSEELHLFDDWIAEKWSPSILLQMGKKKKQILAFSEKLYNIMKQEIEDNHLMRKGQQQRKSKEK